MPVVLVVVGPAFVEPLVAFELVLVEPPQLVPALHTHMPPAQRWPGAQVNPHPPQFWVSDPVGMQAPSQ